VSGGYPFLWALLFVVWVLLAVACFRKRHLVLFVIGFIFPLLWIIGALLPPAERRT
jgi:hypothetical protein